MKAKINVKFQSRYVYNPQEQEKPTACRLMLMGIVLLDVQQTIRNFFFIYKHARKLTKIYQIREKQTMIFHSDLQEQRKHLSGEKIGQFRGR